ncbi:hypothetical protein GCT13_09400 [Paraburkholderia sp. CNPSo 3157]|uniref:Uncharacterized protein n=1 Tax=Paraburkholderia franconis TaxID=2654983 RepID=A0A7X1N8Y6_9BURK|nr:hypothetical protein [Paraburkholderia franconis]MPW17138.1 hypothetical protein [Paraburkholderia franconis]
MVILSEGCQCRHAGVVWLPIGGDAPALFAHCKMQQAIPQTGHSRVKFAKKGRCYSTFHFMTT